MNLPKEWTDQIVQTYDRAISTLRSHGIQSSAEAKLLAERTVLRAKVEFLTDALRLISGIASDHVAGAIAREAINKK